MRDAKVKSLTSMTESIRISWSHERLPDCQADSLRERREGQAAAPDTASSNPANPDTFSSRIVHPKRRWAKLLK